jgi:hypothetical protein
MPNTRTVKSYSDSLEKIFWKGYEFYRGNEHLSLRDMVIDAGLIAKDLGISRGFVLKWITIIQKEMGLKSI